MKRKKEKNSYTKFSNKNAKERTKIKPLKLMSFGKCPTSRKESKKYFELKDCKTARIGKNYGKKNKRFCTLPFVYFINRHEQIAIQLYYTQIERGDMNEKAQ